MARGNLGIYLITADADYYGTQPRPLQWMVDTAVAHASLQFIEKSKMKITQYGTTIVIIHAITNGLHGLAHLKIPVPLSLFQSLFVGIVIFLIPIIAVVLLWTQFYRIGSWLLLGAMAGSLLFGIYNHFIVISPDHVSQVSFEGWGLFFQVTAILILIVDGFGCWISIWALKTIQQSEKVL